MSKDVNFGLALKYDDGVKPSVAINKNGDVVEVHKSQSFGTLWYHIGKTKQMDITWGTSYKYDDGQTPSVALNDNGLIVEVHQSQSHSTLWCHVGQLNGSSIDFGGSHKYDDGVTPSITLNNNNWCVEVHKSQGNSGLWYRVGQVNPNDKTINWGSSNKYDDGNDPQVCMNNSGVIIEVHKSQAYSTLWYYVGIIDESNKRISWGASYQYDNGVQPTIAITDNGFVIELHKSQSFGTLWRRVGTVDVNSKTINFSASSQFDDGQRPSVACAFNGSMAVQTHQSETFTTLWSSTSLVVNRSDWMGDHLPVLKTKTLKQIALPASHDSGMYLEGIAVLGKTQDLNIYNQLSYGIRYYDLRPSRDGNDFYIYHGPIKGPKLTDVLTDIQRFMNEGHHELVILKFSHYSSNFNNDIYKEMVQVIQSSIGKWLFTTLSTGQRLADIPLGNLISNTGVILVVCDDHYPVDQPESGIWVYRDWESDSANQGDLRVFDKYSNTMSYDTMRNDQIQKFNNYNGKCQNDSNLPCDLFLLSWTLTPPTDVWDTSKEANRNLGSEMTQIANPNSHGCFLNLIYVDYVEYARVTDVAMALNGLI